VAIPTNHTALVRTPATMIGSASGSSTLPNTCRGVMPSPRAASTSSGWTLTMPVTVLRAIGRMP